MGSLYQHYFGISEDPFAITPNPRYLFLSQRHQEALAHLLFGVRQGSGFVLLTGEVGTGKTTLCRSLVERVPGTVDLALILNPRQSPGELLASICDELGVAYPAGTESLKVLVDALNAHLLASHVQGRQTVVIIDEAQNLAPEVLEQIRLLTNLETAEEKLLQIILVGQPELRDLLGRRELRQLAQRVTARYHLGPLSAAETVAYVNHRLKVAGVRQRLFSNAALRAVCRRSGGVPRLVNVICQRALLGAYAEQKELVTARMVKRAAREAMGAPAGPAWWPRLAGAAAVVALLVVAIRILQPMANAPDEGPAAALGAAAVATVPAAPPAEPPPPHPEAPPAESSTTATVAAVDEAVSASSAMAAAPAEDSSLVRLLTEPATEAGPAAAFHTLFASWGLDYEALPGETACDRAAAAGLECLYGSGTLTRLGHYNYPAVLELLDSSGARRHVALVGLSERSAELQLGDVTATVPRSEVEQLWFGEYLLLWKRPPLRRWVLREGSRGGDVLWLRRQIAEAEGGSAPSEDPAFDAALTEQVRMFQKARGLLPDGVVGKETLIQLSAVAAGSAVPLLRTARE